MKEREEEKLEITNSHLHGEKDLEVRRQSYRKIDPQVERQFPVRFVPSHICWKPYINVTICFLKVEISPRITYYRNDHVTGASALSAEADYNDEDGAYPLALGQY